VVKILALYACPIVSLACPLIVPTRNDVGCFFVARKVFLSLMKNMRLDK